MPTVLLAVPVAEATGIHLILLIAFAIRWLKPPPFIFATHASKSKRCSGSPGKCKAFFWGDYGYKPHLQFAAQEGGNYSLRQRNSKT